MNPVAMTSINPRNKYWPSQGWNQQPLVFKSATLLTELQGSAAERDDLVLIQNELRVICNS